MVQTGDDLAEMILAGLDRAGLALQDGDILVLAQKIVSKAEGRLVNLRQITPSKRAYELSEVTRKDPRLVEVILSESREVLRTRPGVMIVEHRLGFICASAGVDHSNIGVDVADLDNWVLLLPEDPDWSAQNLRERLEAQAAVQLGVAIIDSHGRAWRNGTVGMAIGLAGVPGVQDLRGKPDLFDFQLQITQVGVADELAAAASLVMGQAREGTPVVHVRGFPYPLRHSGLRELLRPKNEDMFR
jgi:coenzyme F420-0:L-glutamate ligase/coenzyme F420-1:gamma-L-glutamate ligase